MFVDAYWKLVAEGINLQDKNIDLFVSHNHSRGVAREAILRSLLVALTPEPFVVKTGFIHRKRPEDEPPKQCDLLVYDPRRSKSYYRLDEFVVVPHFTVRTVVEVKSWLDQNEFTSLKNMTLKNDAVVLGFAFEGVSFSTFCGYLSCLVTELGDLRKTPEAIVVHRGNYFGARARSCQKETSAAYLAADLSSESPGRATARFLDEYMNYVTRESVLESELHSWFNNLPLSPGKKTLIRPDGRLTEEPATW